MGFAQSRAAGISLLRRIVPWVVAALLLGWIFSRIPAEQFLEAMGRGQLEWFIPAMLGLMTVIYLADSFAISKTFTWFTAPLRFREVLPIRGASYLLSVVNYNLGQGAIVVFARRAHGVSVARATGTVLLAMGINLAILLILSSIGLAVAAPTKAMALRPWVHALLGALGFYLLVISLRPARLLRFQLLQPALRAGPWGHLKALGVRLPHIALVFLAHWLGQQAFGVHPPLVVFLSCMPLVTLMSALPISPQGLGTAQVAAVYFFSPYADGSETVRQATVLAYSLTASVLAMLFMLLMGLLWLRRGMRLLGWGAAAAAAGDAPGGLEGAEAGGAPAVEGSFAGPAGVAAQGASGDLPRIDREPGAAPDPAPDPDGALSEDRPVSPR